MKRLALSIFAVVAAVALTAAVPADAKRLGGGGSSGAQRSSITPKSPAAAPNAASQPVMPATPGAALPAKPGMPAAAPAAASGMSKWMGPIAGIAAGLGLAALLSHFGLPEGLGSFLLLALLAIGVVFVVRAFLARRTPARSPMQYAGAGADGANRPAAYEPPPAPAWGGSNRVEPVMGGAAAGTAAAPRAIPAGFDVAGFEKQAKQQFILMQSAYDSADRTTLSELTTPEMYAEIARELAGRGTHRPTEVVTVNAELVEVVTEGGTHWASVRYTGMVKEDGEPVAKPIDEAWNLAKPVDGSSGWLLAGIQQYA